MAKMNKNHVPKWMRKMKRKFRARRRHRRRLAIKLARHGRHS